MIEKSSRTAELQNYRTTELQNYRTPQNLKRLKQITVITISDLCQPSCLCLKVYVCVCMCERVHVLSREHRQYFSSALILLLVFHQKEIKYVQKNPRSCRSDLSNCYAKRMWD